MGFNIITDYPSWFIFFCLIAGFGYAFGLYYKEKKFQELTGWIIGLMFSFRFLAISILAFLLLSPLLKTIFRKLEKPVIVIAQDNSESLVMGQDSTYYKIQYKENLNKFIDGINDKFDVQTYSFGEKVSSGMNFSFNEKQTDLSSLFDEIETRYSNRNLGAVILASDGLYNKGFNPVYSSGKIKAPVYTIALGDTGIKKDIVLTKVAHNRLAYLGNKFPLEIIFDIRQFKGKSTTLTVSKGKEILFTQKIDISKDNFKSSIPVQIEAKQTGLQHYRVSLSALEDETNLLNNHQEVFIDVLDDRQKVLILAASPHPDLAALKETIEHNQNYEVESYLIDKFDKPFEKYNLIVLHQLPSSLNTASSAILNEISNSNIPLLYILGAQSSLTSFNNLQTGLNISSGLNKFNESEPVLGSSFPLFTLSDETRDFIKQLPVISCPFGNYKVSNSANVLLSQKIGTVETQTPLFIFNQNADRKTGTFAGEGIWKWKLKDFQEHNNHDVFNELISKTVQYLSLKLDKSFFRIINSNNFHENEPLEFDAEVYNESYELLNEPEVSLNIINADNKKFPFTFSKTSTAYHLNAGMFPVGEYKYEAKVKVGEKLYSQKGEFSVSALQVESFNTVADHQLLYSLAKKHEGEMVYPGEFPKLLELINKRQDLKTVSYVEKKLTDLINLKWIFFVLLCLLSFEWLLRKRSGGY